MNIEFDRYYNELERAYNAGELYFTRNTDSLHNAAIMLLMLRKGTQLSMFCGAMSIFKNNFYTQILNEDGQPDTEIKQNVSDAFINFISKSENKIDIILEKESVNLTDDLIFDANCLSKKNVKIYQIPAAIREKANLNHFSFIDNSEITRLESDALLHTALCKIGKSSEIESLVKSFDKLRNLSRRVTIAN